MLKDYTGQINPTGWKAIAPTGKIASNRSAIWLLQCCSCGKQIEHDMKHWNDSIKTCDCHRISTTSFYIQGEEVKCVTAKQDVFFIDLVDLPLIYKYSWCKANTGYFVARDIGRDVVITLHTLLMNTPKDKVVDHIDRDKSNNRRSNLRICTALDNGQNNVKKIKPDVGVWFDKKTGKWCAALKYNYKKYWLGRFYTKEEAIQARLVKEKELNCEYFPKKRMIMAKLTKKRRQSIEETIKFLEDKKTEYCLEAGRIKVKIQQAFDREEIAQLKKELDDWNDLYSEAEMALLYIKTALIFEED